jgi:radical SAM protein (TIGR01212 family)
VYRTLSQHYREKFGCKVYKLAIDAGFTCPNRDGTLSHGGCSFCSAAGGGDFAEKRCVSISDQLEKAKARVAFKNRNGKYIAYFQSFTNTYAPVAVLESLYRQAIEPEEILGLSIGTRPDCLPDDVVELLAQINREKPVSVELGLQTVHDETAEDFNRGYKTEIYFDALRRLKAVGIEVVTHIILGLPGETPEMMAETTRQVCQAGTDGVKFHLLHVLRGTRLEQQYREGKLACMTLPEYAAVLKRCLAQVPEHVVVHCITGDGAKKDLIAPMWSADKKAVLAYLQEYLKE